MQKSAFILGNQLYPIKILQQLEIDKVFMAECDQLATHGGCHKQKIVLFLSAMRSYRDELTAAGLAVHYIAITDAAARDDYTVLLQRYCSAEKLQEIYHFEIEDYFLASQLAGLNEAGSLQLLSLPSPGFLCPRVEFADYLKNTSRPFMKTFYEGQRRRTGLLMAGDQPIGGQYSYDTENRKKLPKDYRAPQQWSKKLTDHDKQLLTIVADRFASAAGSLDQFIWPTTRQQALAALQHFIDHGLHDFGSYQDAIDADSPFLNHCLLSPALNMGLILPRELVEAVAGADVPLNSKEGFIRQVIGWREFVRGIYHNFRSRLYEENQWDHHRPLTRRWYTGQLGIPPVDDAILKAQKYGYNHHIERLMVIANFMNLCEIKPQSAYGWFMEMFVDSSDWVMAPNVFAMGLTSTSKLFATKPYISGSNYILKMSSSYTKGPWCEIWDGLYWRFIATHRERFRSHPRMAMMVRQLERMPIARFTAISDAAEDFLDSLDE